MAALVSAAMETDLCRFYPFTSHNLLRFSPSRDLHIHRARLAPVFIAVTAGPDRYVVCAGSANAGPWDIRLETSSAAEAAVAGARLVAGWSADASLAEWP
jgi:hypothetical protein